MARSMMPAPGDWNVANPDRPAWVLIRFDRQTGNGVLLGDAAGAEVMAGTQVCLFGGRSKALLTRRPGQPARMGAMTEPSQSLSLDERRRLAMISSAPRDTILLPSDSKLVLPGSKHGIGLHQVASQA